LPVFPNNEAEFIVAAYGEYWALRQRRRRPHDADRLSRLDPIGCSPASVRAAAGRRGPIHRLAIVNQTSPDRVPRPDKVIRAAIDGRPVDGA
jgi:hypothetical protein